MITSLNQYASSFNAPAAQPQPFQQPVVQPQADQVMFSGSHGSKKGFWTALLAAAGVTLLSACGPSGTTGTEPPPPLPSSSAPSVTPTQPATPVEKPLDKESQAVKNELENYRKMLSSDLENLGTTAALDPTGGAGGTSTQTVFKTKTDDTLFVLTRIDNPTTEGVDTYALSKTRDGSTPNSLIPESGLSYMAGPKQALIMSFVSPDGDHFSNSPKVSEEVLNFILDVDKRLGK